MTVRIEIDGPVTTIVHARAEARNAVDPDSADALVEAFLAFERDPDASVAVFWGAGGAFCAGFDLKYAAGLDSEVPLGELAIPDRFAGGLGDDIARGPMGPTRLALSKPVIAAIEGPAVAGGMELALWCDMRVMAQDAYMGVYCRRWGVPLIDGGTVRLPRLVGMGRAMDIVLTGRKVDAEECLRIGLCERLAPPGEARQVAQALAQDIARFPQACMRADRASALAQWDLSMAEALKREWRSSTVLAEGIRGAQRFASGKGRGGDFGDI